MVVEWASTLATKIPTRTFSHTLNASPTLHLHLHLDIAVVSELINVQDLHLQSESVSELLLSNLKLTFSMYYGELLDYISSI